MPRPLAARPDEDVLLHRYFIDECVVAHDRVLNKHMNFFCSAMIVDFHPQFFLQYFLCRP